MVKGLVTPETFDAFITRYPLLEGKPICGPVLPLGIPGVKFKLPLIFMVNTNAWLFIGLVDKHKLTHLDNVTVLPALIVNAVLD